MTPAGSKDDTHNPCATPQPFSASQKCASLFNLDLLQCFPNSNIEAGCSIFAHLATYHIP